jgi:hypothetical protein
MLIGREHNPTLEAISKWNRNWVLGLSAGMSLFINIGHIFQFVLNNSKFYTFNKLDYFSDTYYYAYDMYPILNRFDLGSSKAVSVYLLVKFFINFLLFFLINTGVEVILLRKLQRELTDKERRLKEMENTNKHPNSDTYKSDSIPHSTVPPMSFRKQRKHHIEEKTERRTIIMVAMNAVLNFILRLPELLFLFSVSNDLFYWDFFLIFPNLPNLITDFAYFMHILTFTSNFLIFYLFNMKFKQTFSEFTHVKKRM